MPRSSKHSSKHGSRDTREYSDSEKDFALKDRKVKDGNVAKVSKDSNSGEKRKLDSKDGKEVNGSGNGEYSEEYGSSKRRKERSNVGQEDRDEGSRKSKTSGDSKSRRDWSLGVYGEDEEMKKSSGGKGDGKHKESGRKERKEGGAEKEMIFDDEEQRLHKQVFENTGKVIVLRQSFA